MPAGFWTQRRRDGQGDARIIAAEQVHALRHLPFGELQRRAAVSAEVVEVLGLSGVPYQRRTLVKRFMRSGEEELRIIVRVDDGTLRGRLNPLAEEMILATGDGEMVSEYTMAAEGNDARRYGWPWRR